MFSLQNKAEDLRNFIRTQHLGFRSPCEICGRKGHQARKHQNDSKQIYYSVQARTGLKMVFKRL